MSPRSYDIWVEEVTGDAWLAYMQTAWRQGEHVCLMGQTGSGKTTLARNLLGCRQYVCALAVKRNDDILDSFPTYGYTVRQGSKAWPPEYNQARVVVWFKPKSLRDIGGQGSRVYRVLNDVFINGGWCVYIDDTGYCTGTLGLGKQLTVLLNQGRSSGVSVVTAMTQPTSVAARIPTETLRQCRHLCVFQFYNHNDVDIISKIAGVNRPLVEQLMGKLGDFDFIWFHRGKPVIVRQTEEQV